MTKLSRRDLEFIGHLAILIALQHGRTGLRRWGPVARAKLARSIRQAITVCIEAKVK